MKIHMLMRIGLRWSCAKGLQLLIRLRVSHERGRGEGEVEKICRAFPSALELHG